MRYNQPHHAQYVEVHIIFIFLILQLFNRQSRFDRGPRGRRGAVHKRSHDANDFRRSIGNVLHPTQRPAKVVWKMVVKQR